MPRKTRAVAEARSSCSSCTSSSRETNSNAKSTPSPSRITENTTERICRCPMEMLSQPKLQAMPMSSDPPASNGTVAPRNAASIKIVMSTMARIDAIVESLIDCDVSSASIAPIPVTPHCVCGNELPAIISATVVRNHCNAPANSFTPFSPRANCTRINRNRPAPSRLTNGCHWA